VTAGLWLSRKDTATCHGVKVRSVRNWVERGHVVEEIRKGKRLVDQDTVVAYLDSRPDGIRRNAEHHTGPRPATQEVA
jgi:phage terminase Nu1 subunit (DNA packaging protein)